MRSLRASIFNGQRRSAVQQVGFHVQGKVCGHFRT